MPALSLPMLGLSLGAAFSWLAGDEIARVGSVAGTRSLWVVAMFGMAVFGPAAAYLLAFSPDWAFAYLYDSQRIPTVITIALAMLCAASPAGGFAFAAGAAATRRPGVVLRRAVVPGALALMACLALLRRVRVYATFAQYHGDFGTESVAGSPICLL